MTECYAIAAAGSISSSFVKHEFWRRFQYWTLRMRLIDLHIANPRSSQIATHSTKTHSQTIKRAYRCIRTYVLTVSDLIAIAGIMNPKIELRCVTLCPFPCTRKSIQSPPLIKINRNRPKQTNKRETKHGNPIA